MKKRIDPRILAEDEAYLERARKIRKYYRGLTSWATMSAILIGINIMTDGGMSWSKWPILIWGIAIVVNSFEYFMLRRLNREWEREHGEALGLPDAKQPGEPDYSNELLREKLAEYRKVPKPWREDDLV